MPSATFGALYGISNGTVVLLSSSVADYTMSWGTSVSYDLDDVLDARWEPVFLTGPTTIDFSQYLGVSGDGEVLLDGGRVFLSNDTTYANGDPAPTFTIAAFHPCFLAGTRIATPRGEVPVERLAAGDLVLTADGRAVPVLWLGRKTILTLTGLREAQRPVRIAAGALGDGLPRRDLCLTAAHALLLDGVLVQAGALLDGVGITRMTMAELDPRFTVFHIETPNHEVILAEGTPAESFIDNVSREAFDNHAEFAARFGAARPVLELATPRALSARQIPPQLRARLAGHAARAEARAA